MSPTRRQLFKGAALFAAPLAIPTIGLATIEPAAPVDGIALPLDPDDVPFTERDHTGQRVTRTWREIDQPAFDALDQITSADFQIMIETASGRTTSLILTVRDGVASWIAPNLRMTRPWPIRGEAALQTLPKWMWRQIGYQALEVDRNI